MMAGERETHTPLRKGKSHEIADDLEIETTDAGAETEISE